MREWNGKVLEGRALLKTGLSDQKIVSYYLYFLRHGERQKGACM